MTVLLTLPDTDHIYNTMRKWSSRLLPMDHIDWRSLYNATDLWRTETNVKLCQWASTNLLTKQFDGHFTLGSLCDLVEDTKLEDSVNILRRETEISLAHLWFPFADNGDWHESFPVYIEDCINEALTS